MTMSFFAPFWAIFFSPLLSHFFSGYIVKLNFEYVKVFYAVFFVVLHLLFLSLNKCCQHNLSSTAIISHLLSDLFIPSYPLFPLLVWPFSPLYSSKFNYLQHSPLKFTVSFLLARNFFPFYFCLTVARHDRPIAAALHVPYVM